jgi:hypothetical protein
MMGTSCKGDKITFIILNFTELIDHKSMVVFYYN